MALLGCATLVITFPNRVIAADEAVVANSEKAITNLLAHMTVEEKVLQLQARDPNGVPRLGVPNLHVGEALHGVVYPGATAFPQAIALGSTWSPDLIEQVAGVIAKESRAVGTHQVFAPMLGLAQDARWGRVEESYGEDPFLVSRIGVAFINGLQGRGAERFNRDHVIATAKHFAADGLPLTGQNGGSIEISERALRETHLLPFEAAVKEARVGAIMPAHHAINGIPCHGNAWLLDDLLRKEWGFSGFIVSDFGDLYNLSDNPEIISQHVVPTPAAAARLGLECGVDMELAPGTWDDPKRVYARTLLEEVQAGHVSMALIDRAAGRVLRAKLALGLRAVAGTNSSATEAGSQLTQPDVDDSAGDLWGRLVRDGQLDGSGQDRRADADSVLNDPAHDALALKAAEKAIVLLKNQDDLLPLQKEKFKHIAVVGPLATNVTLGGYSTSKPKFYVNVVDGLKAQFGKAAEIAFAPGCELESESSALLPAAVEAARTADVVVCVVGCTRNQMGENLDRDNLNLVGGQERLVEAVHATGKPVVVVLLNGGPISIPWIKNNIPAIVEGWYLGQATGTALAQVLTGEVNPGGKLPVTIPQNVGRAQSYYYRPPAARRINYYRSPGGDLFPFGHGLSYTKFAYSDLKISPDKFATNQTATVSVKLTNAGARAGDEVVQLYLHENVSSLVRPSKELRGFERVTVAPGESREVKFPVGFDHLKFWKNGGWVVEPGIYTVMIGSSSEDIRLKGRLEIRPPK